MKFPTSHSEAKAHDGKTVTIARDLSPFFQKGMTAEIEDPTMQATNIRRGREVRTVSWSDIFANPF